MILILQIAAGVAIANITLATFSWVMTLALQKKRTQLAADAVAVIEKLNAEIAKHVKEKEERDGRDSGQYL